MSSRDPVVTRVAILDAARTLFEVDGYFSVGLDAVARKAGVSRQAIYLHFDSKADLLRELHLRINELDVAPAFERVWGAKSAVVALDRWVEASAQAIPKFMGIYDALEAAARVDAVAEETWQAPAEGHYADCRRLAEWLRRDAVLRAGLSVADAADLIWSIPSVRGYESLVVARGWSDQKWIRWQRKILRDVLL